MQGQLSIERMCHLAQVSRAGFYRSMTEKMPAEEELEVRAAVQRLRLSTAPLRVSKDRRRTRRQGMQVNRKRVSRIMREDNLLAVQPRSFVVTTDSHHELEVYLNMARRMKLTGINQLWVADITYIRLSAEFVYLAVILDAYLAEGRWMGTGLHIGNEVDDRSVGESNRREATTAGPGASLRSRLAVRLQRLRERCCARTITFSEHEPSGESV